MEYIDLVLVKHKPTDHETYLFQAPRWSGLKKGDEVVVETSRGEKHGVVIDCHTTSPEYDTNEFGFIITASKATLPLKKVLQKVEYKTFVYPEEEPEEAKEGNEEWN